MRIICDFDGTITRQDTTDLVLERLADRRWAALQDAWLAGKLSGADCMTGQIALVGGSQAELDAVLDSVQLDPGFAEFVAWCEAFGFPISIVSDGVDRFIDRILTRAGLDRVTATANRLEGEAGAWRLELPWRERDCAAGSGVCKCAVSAAGEARPMVYVGDGRSDFCVSARADIVFAKGALADHCAAHGRSYYPFDTFHDVRRRLTMLVGAHPAVLGEAAQA